VDFSTVLYILYHDENSDELVIINLSLILVRSLEEMCEKYVEENEKSILKKRLRRLSRRLLGKIDPAVIASIVREDREKR